MAHEKRAVTVVGLIVGLLMMGGCGSDSSQTGGTGQVLLETPAANLIAQAASGQCTTQDSSALEISATLDIVGVRSGIPMTVKPDCTVSATVPDVPVGTFTFRIIYRIKSGGIALAIAEATGSATVTANTTTPVSLKLTKLSGPAIAISAGSGHSCAVLADRTVQCWS